MTNTKRVNEFMSKETVKKYKCLELETENGLRYIERFPLKEMKKMIKEYADDNGYTDENDSLTIKYKDGTIKNIIWLAEVKYEDIEGVIFDNEATTAIAGKGVEIVNYDDLYENWGGEDWRAEFAE